MASEHEKLRNMYAFSSPDGHPCNSNISSFDTTRSYLSELWGIRPEEVNIEDVIAVINPRKNSIFQGAIIYSCKSRNHTEVDTDPSIDGVITQEEK